MKTLCITGVNSADLLFIQGVFAQAGMALPRPAQRDETLTMGRWHEQIQSIVNQSASEPGPVELGRVWEQLATDLFVANLDQPVWGWSSAQSVPLLDFWQAFDPQVRFVLVTCSAQRFIANALESGPAMPATNILLEQWAAQHLQLLQFYHRFSQKAVLVDIDHCIDNPAGLIKVCEQSWQLGLSKVHFPSQVAPSFSTISRFLAESLSQTDKQWLPLQNELWASATPIGTLCKKPSQTNVAEAVRAYREDKQQTIELSVSAKKIEQLTANITQLKEENALIHAEAQQTEHLQQTKTNQLSTDLNDERAKGKRAADQVKDDQGEADLLLVQLHQVQEELEGYYLKSQEFKQELVTSAASLNALNNEKDEIKAKLEINLVDLKKCASALSAAQSALAAQQTTAKELNTQLNDERAQRETVAASLKALTSERDEIKAQLAINLENFKKSTTAHIDAQSALAAQQTTAKELNTKLNDELAKRVEAAAQLKDAQEEADLLLVQLHQVQEELENYFLQYQDSKQALKAADMRWLRMLQRVPDYFDVESVEVQRIEGVGAETLRWRLTGLEAAGRKLPELELTSFIVDGIAGLELPRKMGEQNVIQRWPVVAASDETLVIAWVGDVEADDKLAETLRQLGRSDWDLIQVIINALITASNTPAMLKRGDGVVIELTPQALGALQSKLSQMPSVFRFDELSLMREQVNHDYEHLWLNFKHVAIGHKRLLDFDFRISCANLRPKVFGQYPKLEFPEASGRAAIAEWFDESYDDFGPKLELRFALPESMDMQVWDRLSVSDREFLETLVQQLPAFLSELEASGVKLKRSWQDWQQLVGEVHRILKVGTEILQIKALKPAKPKRLPPPVKRVAARPGAKRVAAPSGAKRVVRK
jgi:hypothetical protein